MAGESRNPNLILFFIGVVGATVLAGAPIATPSLPALAYMVLTNYVLMRLSVGRLARAVALILLAVPLFAFRAADRDDRHGPW